MSPSSLTAPCASLPKLCARLKRTTIPNRGGPVFGQGYTSSCTPLLEPPNKLSRKGRGTRDQIANIRWIIKKAREFQKNIYFCFIDYAKAFDCVDHNKLWKILKDVGIPDHLTCLLRNLYAGQEATVRTGHGTTELVPNQDRSTSRLYIVTLLI